MRLESEHKDKEVVDNWALVTGSTTFFFAAGETMMCQLLHLILPVKVSGSLLDLILVCSPISSPSQSERWDLPLGRQESLVAAGTVAL